MATPKNTSETSKDRLLPDDAIDLVRTYAQRLVRFAHDEHAIATTLTQLVADIATGVALEGLPRETAVIPKHCALMLDTLSRAYRRSIADLLADAHAPDEIGRRTQPPSGRVK